MSNITLTGIATFKVNNYDEAVGFYCNFLGFRLDWHHRMAPDQPVYMQVSKNGLLLHLSDNPRFREGSVVFVDTKGIDDLHAELSTRQGDNELPVVEATPWGTRQLEIADPSGNILRFNQPG